MAGRVEEDNCEQKYLDSICIKNQNGQEVEAKYAVITVPLTVLQDGDIRFVPCLPVEKEIAISSIHMGGALKIVCRFTKQFWPSSVRALYAASGFISQLWFYSRDPESSDAEQFHGEKCHLATGFATDEWADRIRLMEETKLCTRFLQQLDEIFRTRDSFKPASDSFMHHVVYDWKKNPFVRGGYSSPTVHACGMREELAKSVGDRMFFAGEATNLNAAATIQSAIETGVRAAEEICQAWKKMEWGNRMPRS